MAINFPSTPTDGQTVEVGGKTYRYSSVTSTWKVAVPTSSTDVSDLTDTTGLLGSGGATVYADMTALVNATGMSNGDFALVGSLNKLYVYYGAWFLVSNLTNSPPSTITGNAATYMLEQDGTPTVITLASTDPEGFDITWSYAVTNGTLGSTATVTQNDNVFTITPSTTEADAGDFTITFTADDGANQVTTTSDFSLLFAPAPSGVLFTTVGSHTWTVPDGVTSVSVLCIGAGGGDDGVSSEGSVGAPSSHAQLISESHSWFGSSTQLLAEGGRSSYRGGSGGSASGTSMTAGYSGGNSASSNSLNCGAGGAAGYGANGGNGITGYGVSQAGGGVGVYGGLVSDGGAGGGRPDDAANGGLGVSGGTNGTSTTAGVYGGGQRGRNRNTSHDNRGGGGGALAYGNNISVTPGATINLQVGDGRGGITNTQARIYGAYGGHGAVRIIWGDGRSFPSTNVDLASSTAGETTV